MTGSEAIDWAPVDVAIVTLNAGRDAHLLRLVEGVARCDPAPSELVVVAMGSGHALRSEVERVSGTVPIRWVDLPPPLTGLPLAAARNAGARSTSCSKLLFLDVDCIPGTDVVERYDAALDGPAVVCGPVRWLERFWDHDVDVLPGEELLRHRSAPHPARPVPDRVADDHRHGLLWSLAFGMRRRDFVRIGGFDEAYVGYGAEDTDLGRRARADGLRMRWLPSGTAYHQWHPTADPPVQHVDSIVKNARRFRDRWGIWPMEGWLASFAESGLVEWCPDSAGLRRTEEVVERDYGRVVSIPATHPYTRKVLPEAERCDPDPTVPWWPHPALEAAWIEDNAHRGDVVHLHFGYEHRTAGEMRDWCRAVKRTGAALVVTVHDVENPHLSETGQIDHDRRTRVVVEAADVVLTLTPSAAHEVCRRWGRHADVVPHPHVAAVDEQRPCRSGPPVIGMDLKFVRSGSLDVDVVLEGLGRGAAAAGGRAVSWVDSGAARERVEAARRAADRHGVQLRVEAPPDDAGLAQRFAELHVAVLPYAWGTHSGLLELCRDVGVRPVVPHHGSYTDQWCEAVPFMTHNDRSVTADAVVAAVRRAVDLGPPIADAPGWRADQLADIRRAHRQAYARARGMVRA